MQLMLFGWPGADGACLCVWGIVLVAVVLGADEQRQVNGHVGAPAEYMCGCTCECTCWSGSNGTPMA
jgi:hypothetical protein